MLLVYYTYYIYVYILYILYSRTFRVASLSFIVNCLYYFGKIVNEK